MTDLTPWQRFFPLFQRHNLLPEPDAAKRIKEQATAELTEMEAQSSRQSGIRNVRKWKKAKEKRYEEFLAAYKAALGNIDNYGYWAPTGEDWMKLAVQLAIKHREPNFSFDKRTKKKGRELNWHRFSLMNSIMSADGVNAKEAAVRAVRYINELQEAGQGQEYGSIQPKSLETAYSTHKKSDPPGTPTYILNLLDWKEHARALFEEARSLQNPPPMFISVPIRKTQ